MSGARKMIARALADLGPKIILFGGSGEYVRAEDLRQLLSEGERMREALELCRAAFDTPIARRRYSDGNMTTAARNAIRQALGDPE